MDKPTADKLRGMIRRVTLKNTNDAGETQRTSVEVAAGVWRDDVEVMQPYGFSSNAPEDGALGIVVAIGGDEGDLIVFPVGNPSKRMGGLQPGEVGIYNEHGDKIVIAPGGGIAVQSAGSVMVESPDVAIVGNVTVTGNLTVDGALHATGNISSDSPDGIDE